MDKKSKLTHDQAVIIGLAAFVLDAAIFFCVVAAVAFIIHLALHC